MIQYIKSKLRPMWRVIYQIYRNNHDKRRSFDVPLNKLLRGGENGIRAAKYAELTNDFLRPSTSVFEGPHVKFLELYDEIGDKIFEDEIFKSTAYFMNAKKCLDLTGSYFYDNETEIKELARRFVGQHKGDTSKYPHQPGQSDSSQPVWLRPIKSSSYFEVIDGNHRIARAILRGDKTIKAMIYDSEPAYTPLQQLLLDCLWINKQKWLYQPVCSPELLDEWTLVRNSKDRLKMMHDFLQLKEYNHKRKSYLDIGSSYGWFVSKFKEYGFDAYGLDRDPFGIDIGYKVYGIEPGKITNSDIVVGLNSMIQNKVRYDIVSCLSVLHHYVLGKSSTSAEEFIKKVDQITGDILFLDTGEEHESAFEGELKGWSPEYVRTWLLENTTFTQVIALGIDADRAVPFENYYSRTLFACTR